MWLGIGAGFAALLVAATVVASGMGDLRGVYLYREASGEGIALAQVAMRLMAGGVLAFVAVAVLAGAAARSSGRTRSALRSAAWAATVALGLCAAVALWVSLQSGCIGACG